MHRPALQRRRCVVVDPGLSHKPAAPQRNHGHSEAHPPGPASQETGFGRFLFAWPACWAKLGMQSTADWARGTTMIDRDVKQIYVGATAIFIFALVLVWLQQ
jgi:hypothetical protein